MKNLPALFVIIPVYKAEAYLSQALESVLGQPYPNIEIVCVDDGSPDDSISILREYEKRYHNIHVIRQENGGVSRARNTGIEYVMAHGREGDFVAFLDADDCWAKAALTESFGNYLDGIDCVGLTSVRCSNDLSRITQPKVQEEKILNGGAASRWCHDQFHMGAMLYSVNLLRRYDIRFIPGLRYGEDSLFKSVCLFLADKIKLVNNTLYLYRENEVGAMHSRKFGIDYAPDIIRGYLQMEEFLKPYENENRGSTQSWHVMAGLYSLEMISEHYQQFRSKVTLEKFLGENPEFEQLIQEMKAADLSSKHQRILNCYRLSPRRFLWECRTVGYKLRLRNMMKKYNFVRNAHEKNHYPEQNIYL